MIHRATADLIDLHRRVGDVRLLRALGQFSVGQTHDALHELCGTPSEPSTFARKLEVELAARDVILITIVDPEYPSCLRALDKDAPPFLYVIGSIELLKARSIAVIGTRNPSALGRAAARLVSEYCAESGWSIVSGNAPGIDASAHHGAVKSGGKTLIFPPTPIEQYVQSFRGKYPQHITIASCFAPGSRVEPWMFLRRNTLVARQCCAAFVAETGTRGGTLDTVKKLRKYGRDIFATDLPETATHCKAHAMLAAGGATLIDASCAESPDLSYIILAAEKCLSRPSVATPVLDDFFPEEFLRDE
jgi:DNA processing protein